MKYKFLEHTADMKFLVHGKTRKAIFENSVLALSEFISKEGKIENASTKRFKISGRDYEELLYSFIDEIIYLLDAENFVPSKAEVLLDERKDKIILKAIIFGDKTANYKNLEGIKSATYSEMYIKKKFDKWEAQVVVDI
jgi:SHS2 domain-containing protein